MSLRTRWLLVPALLLLTQVGCRHTWFKKRDTGCPPPPPPGAPFIAPSPGGFGGAPVPQGDVLLPAPLPHAGGSPTPAPPPTFPGTPSNFPPIASFYPPATSLVPPVRLLPPEIGTRAPAAGLSESASSPAASAATPSLPVGIPEFATALPDRVAGGRKPALDGLDWLKANGYKAVLLLHRPGVADAGDRRQFEQRGLTFTSLEVEPAALTWATVDAFARAVGDPAAQPLFVYDADGSLAGGLWYLYFRRVERLSDDAARVRAGRLGWRDGAAGPHREMAEAAKSWPPRVDARVPGAEVTYHDPRGGTRGSRRFRRRRPPPRVVLEPTMSIDPILGTSQPLVPPLYPAAVYTLPDLDALDRIMNGQEPGFIYARDGHPNGQDLAARIAKLERGQWGIVTGSGMGAITASVLALLQAGDRVVASDKLYGRTAQLFQQELTRFGILITWVDVTDLDSVRRALDDTPAARVLFIETMSNPLLRVADIEKLAGQAYARHCKLIVDNTFATPVLAQPLELGADLVIESLTKLIGGHSDLTLGVVCGDDADLFPAIGQVVSIWGLAAPPFDCWLATRGLATMDLRVRAATANAALLADWLARRSDVSQVIYPGRPDHPDLGLVRRLLPHGCGNMLCFELAGGREAVNRFLRQAPGVPFSPSLGHTTTTCSYPAGTSHRYVSPAERRRQGISDGLVRLSVGIESFEQIKAELARGL